MSSLALQKTHTLETEWMRLRSFLMRARTSCEHRDHAAKTMLAIEKELAARKPKASVR
jgi:hypothetical protein